MMRIILAITLLAAIATSALAFGLGKEGARGGFGSLGSMGKVAPAVVIPSCNGTGLDFSVACNSQYIGTLS